jgi:hypothetical protein
VRCHGEDCVLDVPCTGYIRRVGQLQKLVLGGFTES